jgi:hypothetical protein
VVIFELAILNALANVGYYLFGLQLSLVDAVHGVRSLAPTSHSATL